MSRIDRALGLARSVATYHAIPFRQRRMRALYATFVKPGDLVFDIGAHAGNRVRAFRALGCRVVAIEPQPDFVWMLRWLMGQASDVEIVQAAVAHEEGTAQLAVSDRTPTVSTIATDWRDQRAEEPDFAGVEWNRHIDVDTTTMDALIARFGLPAFVKIDVEGGELAVLSGLSRAVPALSFEYLPRALDAAEACLQRLLELGPYEFNWSRGETNRFVATSWLDHRQLIRSIRDVHELRSGDIYARLPIKP